MGAADGDRRRAARRRGGGDACAAPWCDRGAFTLGPVDLQIDWADRVAITGPNGSGKSTLLAALLGRLPLDEGDAVARARRRGRRGRPGARRCSSATSRCCDAFARAVPDWPTAEVRTLLAKFGLRADHVLRAGRRRCRPASAPGPRWRCCRPAG